MMEELSTSAKNAFTKGKNAIGSIQKTGIKKAGTAIKNTWKYYYSQVSLTSYRCGRAAVMPILKSNIPGAIRSFTA